MHKPTGHGRVQATHTERACQSHAVNSYLYKDRAPSSPPEVTVLIQLVKNMSGIAELLNRKEEENSTPSCCSASTAQTISGTESPEFKFRPRGHGSLPTQAGHTNHRRPQPVPLKGKGDAIHLEGSGGGIRATRVEHQTLPRRHGFAWVVPSGPRPQAHSLWVDTTSRA